MDVEKLAASRFLILSMRRTFVLELRDFRLLAALAASGSMVRAARTLGVTQSAVTRSLSVLETRLGMQLFDRSRRGLEPTDTCRALLGPGAEIQRQLTAVETTLAGLRGHHVSELAIAAGPYALDTVVTAAAARFTSAHPDVKLRIAAGAATDAVRELRARRVELAIAEIGELDAPEDFRIVPLRRHPILLLVRPGHPLTRMGNAPEITEVLRYPVVVPGFVGARIGPYLAAARTASTQAGSHPAFPAIVMDSLSGSIAIAARSDAIAGVTAPAAATALRAGDTVLLSFHVPWLVTNFGILVLRTRPMGGVLEQFAGMLAAADKEAAAEACSLAPFAFVAASGEMAVQGHRLAPAIREGS
jgi:DNA-binding transcriptional LysR family regulator